MAIPSFREFVLNESLTSARPIIWQHKDQSLWDGMFTTPEGLLYKLALSRTGSQFANKRVYELSFMLDDDSMDALRRKGQRLTGGNFGVTGSGEAFTVFASVIGALKEFIASIKPDTIVFDGSSASRVKLYDRFIAMVQRALPGYKGASNVRIDNNHAYYEIDKITR